MCSTEMDYLRNKKACFTPLGFFLISGEIEGCIVHKMVNEEVLEIKFELLFKSILPLRLEKRAFVQFVRVW